MPEEMVGVMFTPVQQQAVTDLREYREVLKREQLNANRLQEQINRKMGTMAELTGVIKYLQALLPSREDMTEDVKIGEKSISGKGNENV